MPNTTSHHHGKIWVVVIALLTFFASQTWDQLSGADKTSTTEINTLKNDIQTLKDGVQKDVQTIAVQMAGLLTEMKYLVTTINTLTSDRYTDSMAKKDHIDTQRQIDKTRDQVDDLQLQFQLLNNHLIKLETFH